MIESSWEGESWLSSECANRMYVVLHRSVTSFGVKKSKSRCEIHRNMAQPTLERLRALVAELRLDPPQTFEARDYAILAAELVQVLGAQSPPTESLLLRKLPAELLVRALIPLSATDLAGVRLVSKLFAGATAPTSSGLVHEALEARFEEACMPECDPLGATKIHALVGCRVALQGLSAQPHLNGLVGLVLEYVVPADRYVVKLPPFVLQSAELAEGMAQPIGGGGTYSSTSVHVSLRLHHLCIVDPPPRIGARLLDDARRAYQAPRRIGIGRRHIAMIRCPSNGARPSQLLTCGTERLAGEDDDDDTYAGVLGQGEVTSAPTPLPTLATSDRVTWHAVTCGAHFTLALSNRGHVYACGNNCGALGLGEEAEDEVESWGNIRVLTRVARLTRWRVCAVAAGYVHALALTADGLVFSWGAGGDGALGHGDQGGPDMTEPTVIGGLRGLQVSAIAAGSRFSLCCTDTGHTYSWGYHAAGLLGQEEAEGPNMHSPRLIAGLRGAAVCALAAGEIHCLALTSTGRLYSWGSANDSRLGYEAQPPLRMQASPRLVETTAWCGRAVVSIACGAAHSLALTAAGVVYAWGSNKTGQLGMGHTTPQARPERVRWPYDYDHVGNPAVAIAAGFTTSVVVDRAGRHWCFGSRVCDADASEPRIDAWPTLLLESSCEKKDAPRAQDDPRAELEVADSASESADGDDSEG